MSAEPTPRTDAVAIRQFGECHIVDAKFARELEREVARLTAECARLRDALRELVRLQDQYRPDPAPHEWDNAWEKARAALAACPPETETNRER